MNSSDEEWVPALVTGRAAPLARSLQPPPMLQQGGRGRGSGRAQLPPPPLALAAIYCLPAAGVALQSPLTFRGGFEVSPTSTDPTPFRAMAKPTDGSALRLPGGRGKKNAYPITTSDAAPNRPSVGQLFCMN